MNLARNELPISGALEQGAVDGKRRNDNPVELIGDMGRLGYVNVILGVKLRKKGFMAGIHSDYLGIGVFNVKSALNAAVSEKHVIHFSSGHL